MGKVDQDMTDGQDEVERMHAELKSAKRWLGLQEFVGHITLTMAVVTTVASVPFALAVMLWSVFG